MAEGLSQIKVSSALNNEMGTLPMVSQLQWFLIMDKQTSRELQCGG